MKLSMSFIRQALPQCAVIQSGQEIFIQHCDVEPTAFVENDGDCSVSIDSRTTAPGSIFIALQGERTDGHNFINQAIEKGARALIVEKDKLSCLEKLTPGQKDSCVIIAVRDTLQALIQMAKNWRARFDCEVVGITGSVGKTTTKEMVRAILEAADTPACLSYKNQNTIVGLCINILNMKKSHKAAVFELGINERGEMKALADILRPTKSLITGIAHSHTHFLGSLKTVAEEKRKIFSYFEPSNIGIINGDEPLLANAYYYHPVVKFGLKMKNQVQARKVKVIDLPDGSFVTQFTLKLYEHTHVIQLKGNHPGRVYNALGAAAVAYFLNIPFQYIIAGLESFDSFEGRFEILPLLSGKGRLINDCYNANPQSMRAALAAFEQMKCAGPKIAVLGQMLELGEKEIYWHRHVGRMLCRAMSTQHAILVGDLAPEIAKAAPITLHKTIVATWQEANEKLSTLLGDVQDALVLVKGSFGVGLSNTVKAFVKK